MSKLRGFFHEYLYYGHWRQNAKEVASVRMPSCLLRGSPFMVGRIVLDFKFENLNFREACHELALWPLAGHLASLDLRVIHHVHIIALAAQMRNNPRKSKGRNRIFSFFWNKKWGGPVPLELELALVYLSLSLTCTNDFLCEDLLF